MTESKSGSDPSASASPTLRFLRRLIDVTPAELPALGWCWLYIFSVLGLVLHSASDPGPDGRRRRGEQSSVAVHRHADRHAGSERAVLGARQAAAAPAVHFAVLSFLCGDNSGVRRGATLGISRAGHLGRPIFLYLDLGVQFVRGFDFLVDGRRYFQFGAGQEAIWVHRRRRDTWRDRRVERDGVSRPACAAGLSACRRGRVA